MINKIEITNNQYHDSVELLYVTSSLKQLKGVSLAYIAMGTTCNKEVFREIGFMESELETAGPNDMILGVAAENEHACQAAFDLAHSMLSKRHTENVKASYPSIASAMKARPEANLCIISVPSKYAKSETMKALNAGMHVLIFSDNISLEDEREIKLAASEKGLLCMGPDCGVTNIGGVSFLVGSMIKKGPIGICAASGAGLQEVAQLIHKAGSGISQGIGTGGKDLNDTVGAISMLAGFDALSRDDETKVIVLISRKPGEKALKAVLSRAKACSKPVVVCFMGCSQNSFDKSGVIIGSNLEDTARKALSLIGIELPAAESSVNMELASAEVARMSKDQKYVRGLFCGGTFCEEAMEAMQASVGGIYSNAPLFPEYKLFVSSVSFKNSLVDCGDEEFTLNRPHPDFDPEPRAEGILREASDPETAVILLDFILGPAVHPDPAGAVIDSIRKAMHEVQQRGGKLSVVASVCGTDADPQKQSDQEEKLRQAGVLVCPSNYQAAVLAGAIISMKREKNKV